MRLDVSPWNIVAIGLTVAGAGCTARTVGGDSASKADDDVTEYADIAPDGYITTYTSYTSVDGYTSYDSVGDLDIPNYYDGYVDGYWGGCDNTGCPAGSLCDGYECVELQPLVDCPAPGTEQFLQIPSLDGALSLAFVDLDESGDEELVAVTSSEFLVADHTTPSNPVITLRSPEGQAGTVAPMVSTWPPMSVAPNLFVGDIDTVSLYPPAGGLTFGSGTALATMLGTITGVAASGTELSNEPMTFAWNDAGAGVSTIGTGPSIAYDLSSHGVIVDAMFHHAPNIQVQDAFWVLMRSTVAPRTKLMSLYATGSSTEIASINGGDPVGWGPASSARIAIATDESNNPLNTGGPWAAIHYYAGPGSPVEPRYWYGGNLTHFTTAETGEPGGLEPIFADGSLVFRVLSTQGDGSGNACHGVFAIPGQVVDMVTGNFDGQGPDELAIIYDGTATGGSPRMVMIVSF